MRESRKLKTRWRSGVISNSQFHLYRYTDGRADGGYNHRKLADRVFRRIWQRVSLELLDAFAWLTDRSGSRPDSSNSTQLRTSFSVLPLPCPRAPVPLGSRRLDHSGFPSLSVPMTV